MKIGLKVMLFLVLLVNSNTQIESASAENMDIILKKFNISKTFGFTRT